MEVCRCGGVLLWRCVAVEVCCSGGVLLGVSDCELSLQYVNLYIH